MLLKRAAQNLAEMRHLKAVDPSGAQTCPVLLPDDLEKIQIHTKQAQ